MSEAFAQVEHPQSLASIVRGFGVQPDAIGLIQRRYNTHWRVRAGSSRYVLRRFGSWLQSADNIGWELDVLERMAACGVPVSRPVGPAQVIDGAVYVLLPWLPGRRLRHPPTSDADYRRLGVLLAQFHAATRDVEVPRQRPGWTTNVDGSMPETGGAAYRAQLLDHLAKVDSRMAEAFAATAAALDARGMPHSFAGKPRRIVHGDFSPWNLRLSGGRLVGLLDFEHAHVDVQAADVAFARRGSHDAVVHGYLEHTTLSQTELEMLDALWLGSVLAGVWW